MRYLLPFFLFATQLLSAQNLYDQSHSKEFALYLYRSGQYDLAAIEYERLLFLDPTNDSLRVDLIRCYSLEKEFDKASARIVAFGIPPTSLSAPIADLYSYNLISGQRYEQATAFMSVSTSLTQDRKDWYQAFGYLLANDYKPINTLIQVDGNRYSEPLRSLLFETQTLRLKRPGLAAAMSTVVPGAGKFYTGDWKDGIVGLLSVGITGFQAYRGFKENGVKSGYGWIFGSLAAGFYLGDIYGSFTSAKRYNKRKTDKMHDKAQQVFMLRP